MGHEHRNLRNPILDDVLSDQGKSQRKPRNSYHALVFDWIIKDVMNQNLVITSLI